MATNRLACPLACLLTVIAASLALAGGQDAGDEPPALGQPGNYSHIIGRYALSVSATPTDVLVEDPILLHVRIRAEGPLPREEYRPQRKHLKLLPEELKQDFYVADLPDRDGYDPATQTWDFYYQLLPRRANVTSIPPLELISYNPRALPQPGYEPSVSESIPLRVRARPTVLAAPEGMYQLARGESVLHSAEPQAIAWWLVAVGLIVPPAGATAAYRVWRYYHPGQAGLRRRRRSRAARRALHRLRQLPPAANGAATQAVLVEFLHARLDLPPAEPTAVEVQSHLGQAGISLPLTEKVGSFFRALDLRYAPVADSGPADPRGQVARLILAVEEEAP